MAIVAKNDRTKLFVAVAGAEAFKLADKIGSMTNLGDVASTDEEVDVTTLESESKEFETGFTDNGTLEVTQNLTADEYTTMMGYKENGTDLKVGISIQDKTETQVVGIQFAKAKVLSVTLGGMAIGGVITVVTSIRLSSKLELTFELPTA